MKIEIVSKVLIIVQQCCYIE